MQDLAELARLPSLAAKRSGETRLATPVLYQASIEAGEAAAEQIARALEETFDPSPVAVGAFELGKGRFEVFAHFAEAPPRDALLALIEHAANGVLRAPLRIEQVFDEDWVTLSQGKRRPVEAGRFLVYGSHDRARVPHRLLAIEIDARQAFGTAHHASTRGCLIALDDVLKRSRPRSILDFGTGTGVLAIAAAKALKRLALASDNDPLAVDIARDNARKNGLASLVRVLKATGFAYDKTPVGSSRSRARKSARARPVRARPHASRHIVPRGRAILSGLTSEQASSTEARYRAHGFILEKRIILDGWTTLVIVRRNGQALRD